MKLYIIATPIGNLEDITLRALRILKEVDFILAEDTRVTRKLLNHYNIDKRAISYHHHSSTKKIEQILDLFRAGHDGALLTDAGTPVISDPGGILIARVLESELKNKVSIIPIPGPTALAAIASIASFSMDRFLFLGFPPHKKGRNKFFEEVLTAKYPVILYESSHRIIKTLEQLRDASYTKRDKYGIVIGRELTKKFETIYRANLDEALEKLSNDIIKGEFTLIVYKRKVQDEKE